MQTFFDKNRLFNRKLPLAFLLILASSLPGCSVLSQIGLSDTVLASSDTRKNENKVEENDPYNEIGANNNASQSDPLEIIDTPPSRPFDEDTLYNLLLGELSIMEQDLPSGIMFYAREARTSQDPGVAQRAALLSRYHRDSSVAVDLAKLWHQLDPESPNSTTNYADMLARTNRPIEAMNVLEETYKNSGNANFEVLRNGRMSAEQRRNILSRLETLNQDNESNQSLIFTIVLLLKADDQNEKALAQVKQLHRLVDDSTKLAFIEANLLAELERHRDAAKVLGKALNKNPENKQMHIEYARMLSKYDMRAAEKEFEDLLKDSPNDVKLLMAHSLAAIENSHYQKARESLNQLVSMHRSHDFANYHLGEIAHLEDKPELAVSYYKKVQLSDFFGAATEAILNIYSENAQEESAIAYLDLLRAQFPQHAAKLWAYQAAYYRDNDDLAGAYDALSQGIISLPTNAQLRIERSFVSDKQNRTDLAEKDLRWVIGQDPNNAGALNALGYMLTTKTDRYSEALELIEKAIAIKPNDAAIRDSLGWIYYKLGRHNDAETALVRAFQSYPDDEIASHLIELYWVTKQKDKARDLYQSLPKNDKGYPLVEETIKEHSIRW